MNMFVIRHSYQCTEYVLNNNKWARILTKGRIAGGGGQIFHREDDVMWHGTVSSIAVRCSSCAVMSLLIFLQRTTHNSNSECFSMGRTTPRNCSFPWVSGSHLTRDSLGPSESTLQLASWSAQPFLRGSWTSPTETQITYSAACRNRPHLTIIILIIFPNIHRGRGTTKKEARVDMRVDDLLVGISSADQPLPDGDCHNADDRNW